jgi:hypothetical protein
MSLTSSNDSAPWVQRMGERLRSNSSTTLHFSFGHDVTILPVMTALGLFSAAAYKPLGTDGIGWSRAFRGGNHVPFCANIVVEKLQCSEAAYVRVLNNQVPGIRHYSFMPADDSPFGRMW